MKENFRGYIEVLSQKNFFILITTLFLGQIASAFLLLSLITNIYTKTGSNFGVSGVVLSLAVPSLLLMTIAGIVSDLIDRRKLIIAANAFISLVVLAIILTKESVLGSISLSFLYFGGNSFFFPAISAATAQVVKKSELIFANSLFFLTLAGGQIFGLFIASIFLFFFGSFTVLVLCEVLLVIAALLPWTLPKLFPRKDKKENILETLVDIFKFFNYIFKAKTIWFYFVVFAAMQGVVAFAATIGPGFFDEVINLPITRSPLLVLPMVALGVLLGAYYAHKPKVSEGSFVITGLSAMGVSIGILSISVAFSLPLKLLTPISALFLVAAGFGIILVMIASRTVLQKRVLHRYQGTIFGANFVLASFLASVMSPFAAGLVALFGYLNVIFTGSFLFLVSAAVIEQMRRRWRF